MSKIDDNTTLPIKTFAAMISLCVGAAWGASSLTGRVTQAETRISSLEANHKEIVSELKQTNETLIEIKTVLKQRTR